MFASPQGLFALTAGQREWPTIGGPLANINDTLGRTCEGLRWKTPSILAFAHNTDKNRTAQLDLATGEYRVLREAGWNTMYAGGGVVATYSDLGYWDSTGQNREGTQFPLAVDDDSGSILILREDGHGVDCYYGSNRVAVFTGGPGGYGATFNQHLAHIIHNQSMWRWSLDTNALDHLFDLPPWMRPIAQYSGGWFLGWHNNVGGIVIWQETDLQHARIATRGIDAFTPTIIRVGNEMHVLYAAGAGEVDGQGRRLILPLNDVNLWPLCNILDPNPPSPPVPPDPPIPPVEDVMYPSMTLDASGFEPFFEDLKRFVYRGANNGRYLTINMEWVTFWKEGTNAHGGGIESDSAFDWVRGEPFAYVTRNGGTFKFPVNLHA